MADEQTNDQSGAEQFEAKARETGWTPQTDFKGDPAKWVDAKSWVERGETYIPFIKKANEQLKNQLSAVERDLAEQRRINQMNSKALDELKTDFTTQTVQVTETEKNELVEQIAAAHEAGDVRLELRLRDQLADVNEKLREAKKSKPSVAAPPPNGSPTIDPAVKAATDAFVERNPWFSTDQVMAAAALAVMNQINQSGEGARLSIDEKFSRVETEVRKRFGLSENPRRSNAARVEGSRTDTTGNSGGGGTDFADLPPDAKAACNSLARRFVGKTDGRGEVRYKTLADYQAQYAKDYFDAAWGSKILTQ